MFVEACLVLGDIQAEVRYISIEPLLKWGDFPADDDAINQWAKGLKLYGINWLIIGACTGTMVEMAWLGSKHPDLTLMPYGNRWTAQPRIEWVNEICQAANGADVPIFLKDNLKPLFNHCAKKSGVGYELRQEFPKC